MRKVVHRAGRESVRQWLRISEAGSTEAGRKKRPPVARVLCSARPEATPATNRAARVPGCCLFIVVVSQQAGHEYRWLPCLWPCAAGSRGNHADWASSGHDTSHVASSLSHVTCHLNLCYLSVPDLLNNNQPTNKTTASGVELFQRRTHRDLHHHTPLHWSRALMDYLPSPATSPVIT